MENPALKRRVLIFAVSDTLHDITKRYFALCTKARLLRAGFFVMVVPRKVCRFVVTTRSDWGGRRMMHTAAPVLRNTYETSRGSAQDIFLPSSSQSDPARFRSAAGAPGHQC